jgi:hypothetical protein
MPQRAYRLSKDCEDVLVGGSINTGPLGETLDIKQALKDGKGVIKTSDPTLQSTLEHYFTFLDDKHVHVFDVATVGEDGEETPVHLQQEAATSRPATAVAGSDVVGAGSDIDSSDKTGYHGLTNEDLHDLINERGLSDEVTSKSTKDDLVAVLEKSDEEGAANGS